MISEGVTVVSGTASMTVPRWAESSRVIPEKKHTKNKHTKNKVDFFMAIYLWFILSNYHFLPEIPNIFPSFSAV